MNEGETEDGVRLVLVTGPSGAGRSTAINILEDAGFETIDNLPLSLLPRLLDGPPLLKSLALGIDVRNRDFSVEALIEAIARIKSQTELVPDLLYLDCSEEMLIRRFSETRRRHPLAPDEDVATGIRREVDLLTPIRQIADVLIDTSDLSPHDLKADILRHVAPQREGRLAVTIQSFSYKRGIPRGIDMVFDCRFLKNPYWDENLRGRDGRDQEVQSYVAGDKRFSSFFDKVYELSQMLLPAYIEEGKAHLSIGFGCTGGQHRSVTLTERLAKRLQDDGWQVHMRHRELDRRETGRRLG